MRLKTLAVVLALSAAASALGGCALFGQSTAQQDAEKALTAAHAAHDATAIVLTGLANSGVLHGSAAATAQSYLDQSEAYLVKADDAYAAGSWALTLADVGSANAITAKAGAN